MAQDVFQQAGESLGRLFGSLYSDRTYNKSLQNRLTVNDLLQAAALAGGVSELPAEVRSELGTRLLPKELQHLGSKIFPSSAERFRKINELEAANLDQEAGNYALAAMPAEKARVVSGIIEGSTPLTPANLKIWNEYREAQRTFKHLAGVGALVNRKVPAQDAELWLQNVNAVAQELPSGTTLSLNQFLQLFPDAVKNQDNLAATVSVLTAYGVGIPEPLQRIARSTYPLPYPTGVGQAFVEPKEIVRGEAAAGNLARQWWQAYMNAQQEALRLQHQFLNMGLSQHKNEVANLLTNMRAVSEQFKAALTQRQSVINAWKGLSGDINTRPEVIKQFLVTNRIPFTAELAGGRMRYVPNIEAYLNGFNGVPDGTIQEQDPVFATVKSHLEEINKATQSYLANPLAPKVLPPDMTTNIQPPPQRTKEDLYQDLRKKIFGK